MKESFLHFVWQYLHFDVRNLVLESGEPLQIIKQGNYQTNAGPDFENCEVRIGDIRMLGNIEIHLRSSDWKQHQHHTDPTYNNVILHVVWEHDVEVADSAGHRLPVLTLKDRITESVMDNYDRLLQSKHDILCADHITGLSELKKVEWLDKAILSRMQDKANRELVRLQQNGGDWEEIAYQLLLRNCGFKVNSEAFVSLAEALPFKIVKKHINQPLQLEALFYGQAGFLHNPVDAYGEQLQQEHHFLRHKYSLSAVAKGQHGWKFLRSRPANFPTVRIAQVIATLQQMPNLFDSLIADTELSERYRQFRNPVSDYWQLHYDFGKAYQVRNMAKMGKQSVDRLLINTIVPLLAAYSRYSSQQHLMDRAVLLMEQLKPEDNFIIRKWNAVNVQARNALDSQALIMQYNTMCSLKKCLECTIGTQLVRG